MWHPTFANSEVKDGVTMINAGVVDGTATPPPTDISIISLVATGPLTVDQLGQDRSSAGRSWDGDIADVYAYRTGKDKDELLALMDKETWMSADSALELGFVDELVQVNGKSEQEPKASVEQKPQVQAISPSVNFLAAIEVRRRRVKAKFDSLPKNC